MALSSLLDFRERVIAAIEPDASRRQAGGQLWVVKASAIHWHARFWADDEIAAEPISGDRHSHRTEAHAAVILQAYSARLPMIL